MRSLPGVVLAAAIVLAGCGGVASDKQETATGPVEISVQGESPVGGVQDITVKQGERVRFTVRSDTAQEIHVHGYDFHKDVPANGSVNFDFPAKINGIFEIELEKPGVQIASLRVNP
jgi:hypothetical protein